MLIYLFISLQEAGEKCKEAYEYGDSGDADEGDMCSFQ